MVSEPISELKVIETPELTLVQEPPQGVFQPAYQLSTEYELPPGYGETRIVLQVRDPYWLHAYWEIARETLVELESKLGPSSVLAAQKILRVHDITNLEFDGTNSWYSFDIPVTEHANNWYINVERANRSYCVDLGLKSQDGSFVLITRSNVVKTPRDGVSEVIDEEWMTIEGIERAVQPAGRGPSSPEFVREVSEKREFLMGSEAITSISSPGRAMLAAPRGFWLKADVEIIVHGATDPTARVTIQGVPVKLRPDGSFSVRFTLPDGTQVIPIEARSADGAEVRTITTTISRKTD
ncbi:MAG TPA: DUF4912 domain-containing protein [Firmicutes bacterium]|nr:DUF4912 domain-containing protein [Bacillota bacterium]